MGFPEYKTDLTSESFDINRILDRYYHSGPSIVFHGAPPETEAETKQQVAAAMYGAFEIQLHPLQLVVCGSAHLGFSPVPDKLGKPFSSNESDIDFAVISPELFDLWWTELQRSKLEDATRELLARDLFWGFINPATARDVSEIGQKWWATFGALRTNRARGIRGRLFKSFWCMQSYHRQGVIMGRMKLFEKPGRTAAGGLRPPIASGGPRKIGK